MFFEEPRTDGLLRGPRHERSKLMTALGKEAWGLETLLGLHLGLLDHAEDVRIAAMEALQHIAQKKADADCHISRRAAGVFHSLVYRGLRHESCDLQVFS